MMILLSAKVLIPVLIILVVALFLLDWKKTRKSQDESEATGSEVNYKRSTMAWFIKIVLNFSFFLFFMGLLQFPFLFGRDIYNVITYQEPILNYSLPITFEVKQEKRENDPKLEGLQFVGINSAQGQINIKSHTAAILFYSYFAILFIYSFTVLYQLRKFSQSLAIKQPFIKDNARRLRIVAGAMIVCELLQGVVCLCSNAYINSLSEFQHFEITFNTNSFSLEVVFFGFILIVIAEAFRCGAELKQENDLTV
jgi:DUF2975 family protein